MKGEVVKYKIRLRETQAELNQVGPQSETERNRDTYFLYKYENTEHRNGIKPKTYKV